MSHRRLHAIAVLLLALTAPAVAQNDVLKASRTEENAGTYWYTGFSNGPSAGAAQLGSALIGPGPLAGLHFGLLKWNVGHLLYLKSQNEVFTQEEILTGGGASFTDCRGVATLDGGFVVNDPNPGDPIAIVPRLGALLWNPTKLFTLEIKDVPGAAGSHVLLPLINDTIRGVSVLTTNIQDTGGGAGVVNAHMLALALAYSDTKLYKIDIHMSGGLFVPAFAELTIAGAAIPGVIGVAPIASGFRTTVSPAVPEGAAIFWTPSHVYQFEHRTTAADTIVELMNVTVPAAPVAISGCWGVIPMYFRKQIGPLPPAGTLDSFPEMLCEKMNLLAGKEVYTNDGAFDSNVVVGANPALKRQASALHELLAKYTLAGSTGRGMVIGQNQRAP